MSVKESKNKNAYKNKLYPKKKTVNLPKGVKEIEEKYHNLVGENKSKYPAPMNGICQGTSNAALLFQDSTKGPELAIEENRYLKAHWRYFKESITFPLTILEGGGKFIVFKY